MKKILLALVLVCSIQAAYAQKPDADIRKSVDKALAATQDQKKAVKPAPWINLGKSYMAAYNNPTANLAAGLDRTTFSMMFKEQPTGQSSMEIDGKNYTVLNFSHVDVFFNEQDLLTFWHVTKPSIQEDPLKGAADAYVKAFELGAKEKDVAPRLKEIADGYYNDAFTEYTLGNMEAACRFFKGAADVSATAPCAERIDDAFYNTAFTALATKNYTVAEEYYKKCIEIDYLQEGNVYASLSDVSLAQADTLKAKDYLAQGITRFPDNASILTNLINLYLSTNEDPAKIVELLDEAKKAMPDNASLYYVEGNIYTGIKDYEKAIAAYNKGIEVQPGYDMAYYGLGVVQLKIGEDLVDQMNALDVREWKKYDEMKAQLDGIYKEAIVLFEKCYESSTNPQVQLAAADFLKRLNFQLRGEGAEYQAAYDKWSEIVGNAN